MNCRCSSCRENRHKTALHLINKLHFINHTHRGNFWIVFFSFHWTFGLKIPSYLHSEHIENVTNNACQPVLFTRLFHWPKMRSSMSYTRLTRWTFSLVIISVKEEIEIDFTNWVQFMHASLVFANVAKVTIVSTWVNLPLSRKSFVSFFFNFLPIKREIRDCQFAVALRVD